MTAKTHCVSCGSRINPKNYEKYGNYCIGECRHTKYNFDFDTLKKKIEHSLGVDDLLKESRASDYVKARIVMVYVLKSKNMTHDEIGTLMKKDKSTITHIVQNMDIDTFRYVLDKL